MTLKKIKAELKRMDPNLSPEDDAFRVGTILLSMGEVGTKTNDLAKFTGEPNVFVDKIKRRLKASGILRDDKIFHSGWFDKDGGMAFWLDVATGLGFLKRS